MRALPGLPERLRPILRETGLLFFFLALAALHTSLWRDPAHRIGPTGDSAHHVFAVNWYARHLLTAPQRLFEGNVFFPYHDAAAFFEPSLGPAVLVAPLTPLIANPILLHNIAVLLVLTTASYGAYRLGLHVLAHRGLAVLAAVALPYSGQQTGHFGHLNGVAMSGFPFLMLGLILLAERPSVGAALLTAFAFGLQAGTSGYQAMSCAVLIVLGLAWGGRSLLRPRAMLFTLGALVLGALLVLPWVRTFLALQTEAGLVRDVEQTRSYSLHLRNYFSTPSLVWKPLFGDAVDTAFPGAVVTLLGAIGLVVARGRHAWFFRLVFATCLVLALGPDIQIAGHRLPLPFGLAWNLVPAIRAGRHPASFFIPGLMALTFLAMMALARLRCARHPLLLWLLGVAIVTETLTSPKLVVRDLSLPPVYDRLRALPAGAFLEVPLGDYAELDWQWRAIMHGLPVVNGFAPFVPRLQDGLYHLTKRQWSGRPTRDLSDTRALAYLKRFFPIRYVVTHGKGWVARSIAATPSFVFEAECAPNDRIYRLVRSGQGPWIERQFRDDQLRGRALRVRLRAGVADNVVVSVNDRVIETLAVGPAEREWRLVVPTSVLVRGANGVVFEGATSFELTDIESEGA